MKIAKSCKRAPPPFAALGRISVPCWMLDPAQFPRESLAARL